MLECLSGSGLRTIRYLKEIPSIKKLVANDLSDLTTDQLLHNLDFNKCPKDKYEGNSLQPICVTPKFSFHFGTLRPHVPAQER